jgi:RHS repeat-associated protein
MQITSYIRSNASRQTILTYLSGPSGIFALHSKNADGSEALYYIHKDHLGSWNTITDEGGKLMQELSFDAWGVRRDPATWRAFTGIPPQPMFDRGFTGHEHLDGFNLINMNGRMYDPVVSRMLSPDNFVQSPDFSQSFNRYSYCANNPLAYTDPSGEFFIADSWLVGFVHGFFSTSSNRGSVAWGEANHRAGMDAKIWGGLFVTDPNKTFGGQVWEVFSRFTWQLPQTIGGWGTAQSYNTLGLEGGVESVNYKYGATVVQTRHGDWGGVTQGSYIVGNNTIRADANNPLFQHEYGHYIQSQSSGWAYYPRFAIPSARSEKGNYLNNYPSHDFHPVEQDANRRAFLYFNKNVEGFYDTRRFDGNGWDWDYNPIDPYQTGKYGIVWDYLNSDDLRLIDNLRVRANLGDYMSWLYGGPVGVALYGLYNSYFYNH